MGKVPCCEALRWQANRSVNLIQLKGASGLEISTWAVRIDHRQGLHLRVADHNTFNCGVAVAHSAGFAKPVSLESAFLGDRS